MSLIKEVFTIKDLENISGIKAHTIRIWEKRYNLFHPERVSRNIRHYNVAQLQKLLNISMLYQEGWKISKIASLSAEEIITYSQKIINQEKKAAYINQGMELAMYKFDAALFEQNYQRAIKNNSFSKVYQENFVSLLYFIGLMWQTDSIKPAHEHFISNLIMQKIILHTTLLENKKLSYEKPVFVLFLPKEEMHEISLLYLNYELKLRGYNTIYLGRSIELKYLEGMRLLFPFIIWASIHTLHPPSNLIPAYFEEIQLFLTVNSHEYWAIGRSLSEALENTETANIKIFPSVKEVVGHLEDINEV